MLMKKLILSTALLAFCVGISAQTVDISWSKEQVDGHRTGVVASNASNVEEAMGSVKGKVYYAPNGKKYRKGSTPEVARLMINAQPAMAQVKEVIGYSTAFMDRTYPECPLYDWFADVVMKSTADSVGRKVDLAILNRGGVRIEMPQGEVLYDDIMSMFPFKNNLCYVALKGKDLKVILDQMAASTFQIVSGVKVVAQNGKIISALVDGEPIDDDKVYGVATLNFLLDGGDGYSIAKNALEVIGSKGWVYDTILAYVKNLTAAGKPIEFENQKWITILKEGDKK